MQRTADEELRDRLKIFYNYYNKNKLKDIEGLVKDYSGSETELFEALVSKYGPEPSQEYTDGDVHIHSPRGCDVAVRSNSQTVCRIKMSSPKRSRHPRRLTAAQKEEVIQQVVDRLHQYQFYHQTALNSQSVLQWPSTQMPYSSQPVYPVHSSNNDSLRHETAEELLDELVGEPPLSF